jgi:hypothetical protein
LPAMDKMGPMSGNCDQQTRQMESFLERNFGFQNIPHEYIVQGVRAFRMSKDLRSMAPDRVIHFPDESSHSFEMTVEEVRRWQNSYAVYADEAVPGMDASFLQRALQGKSEDGDEAFRMKFVARISTCPVLMDFDGSVIPRKHGDDWPNRIKLISGTGIDFAGRKHDVGDILRYISNWDKVFEIDAKKNQPALENERDFRLRRDRVRATLRMKEVQTDLIRMASLRLRACDAEGVEIVVETGIGLGVFAGQHLGIDDRIRQFSARAIRTVLERDGPSFKKIRAVVLALPIFADRHLGRAKRDTFHDFAAEFQEPKYNGCIPVMIADQDMLRLTVAIACQGFSVCQLNPGDSHGVFGEYWQNRGPAVEEKLALATVGLLVQHHLINEDVSNDENYKLIRCSSSILSDW